MGSYLLNTISLNLGLFIRSGLHMSGKVKGALQGLRQFLASESPLKKMKDAFYFALKARPEAYNFI